MIRSLQGKIIETGDRFVIIGINGIGYKVNTTDDNVHLVKNGEEKTFFTHLAVREDALDLYGFQNSRDRDFFEILITVSGIGPKSALNILSLVASETLISAIRNGSVPYLVKISGIGKKTAEKIVLELRDKIEKYDIGKGQLLDDSDVIEALKALGYGSDQAREVIKKIDKEIIDTGERVKAALKLLS